VGVWKTPAQRGQPLRTHYHDVPEDKKYDEEANDGRYNFPLLNKK
jgi:hypothetical protein